MWLVMAAFLASGTKKRENARHPNKGFLKGASMFSLHLFNFFVFALLSWNFAQFAVHSNAAFTAFLVRLTLRLLANPSTNPSIIQPASWAPTFLISLPRD
jgi:hypothetical protein